jgi:AcrR family transcriptional regulator
MTLATRAKSPEQKDGRKNLIMDAVDRLFQEKDYKSIRMEMIAKKAGLSKGTVFFYFKTKQELFLAYTRIQVDAWQNEVDSRLARLIATGKKIGIDAFLETMRDLIKGKRTLFRLITIMDSIIEVDIDEEILLDFKIFLSNRMVRTGELLERLLDIFRPGDGVRFYLYEYFIIKGMYPMAEKPPTVKRLHKRPELQMWNIDFEETLLSMLHVLLMGWSTR